MLHETGVLPNLLRIGRSSLQILAQITALQRSQSTGICLAQAPTSPLAQFRTLTTLPAKQSCWLMSWPDVHLLSVAFLAMARLNNHLRVQNFGALLWQNWHQTMQGVAFAVCPAVHKDLLTFNPISPCFTRATFQPFTTLVAAVHADVSTKSATCTILPVIPGSSTAWTPSPPPPQEGDFNAKVGQQTELWEECIGHFGLPGWKQVSVTTRWLGPPVQQVLAIVTDSAWLYTDIPGAPLAASPRVKLTTFLSRGRRKGQSHGVQGSRQPRCRCGLKVVYQKQ